MNSLLHTDQLKSLNKTGIRRKQCSAIFVNTTCALLTYTAAHEMLYKQHLFRFSNWLITHDVKRHEKKTQRKHVAMTTLADGNRDGIQRGMVVILREMIGT